MFSVLCSNGLYLLMAVKHRLMFAIEGGKQLSYLEHCLEQAMLFIIRLFEKLIVSVTIFIAKKFVISQKSTSSLNFDAFAKNYCCNN